MPPRVHGTATAAAPASAAPADAGAPGAGARVGVGPVSSTPVDPIDDLAGWSALLADQPMPACMVDLDALHHNRRTLEAALAGSTARLRVSTAALRSTGLLRYLFTAPGHRLQGLMCATACEADVLVELGFDDILVSTPPARPREAQAIAKLVAQGRTVVATVDCLEHVALISAAGMAADCEVGVCIDVDASWQPAAEVWFGTRRSALRSVLDVRSLAAQAMEMPGIKVVGVSAYAAQLSAPAPRGLGGWLAAPFRGMMRARSAELAASRRREVAEALKADGHAISMVVGGSTGGLRSAAADASLTDVPVGEGLLCPLRCDGGELDLRPALHFAMPVVRRPDADHVTCRGGGYISSGPVPGLPAIVLPEGLQVTANDGWAQVQTPLRIVRGEAPAIGAPVVCRPHRAAAVLERFNDVVVHQGTSVVEVVPTYRALGLAVS